MQSFISKSNQDPSKKWIYDVATSEHEKIILDHALWTIVTDKLSVNPRFLVVFKDKQLKTIRDLRVLHLPMLRKLQRIIVSYFDEAMQCFFHYFPSVYQLHMHVTPEKSHKVTDRAHPLHCVINNLQNNSNYYQNALILTRMHKSMRNHNIHKKMVVAEDEIVVSTPKYVEGIPATKKRESRCLFQDDMRLRFTS